MLLKSILKCAMLHPVFLVKLRSIYIRTPPLVCVKQECVSESESKPAGAGTGMQRRRRCVIESIKRGFIYCLTCVCVCVCISVRCGFDLRYLCIPDCTYSSTCLPWQRQGKKALNLTPASPFETCMIRSWCLALRGIQLHK